LSHFDPETEYELDTLKKSRPKLYDYISATVWTGKIIIIPLERLKFVYKMDTTERDF